MIIEKPEEKKQYDRFRHRIMFPIRDQRGRTIGFGGRVLDDGTPKYLNSPETPVFHKGRELYGLYEARKALKDIPYLIMVEGYMDVIALAQYGIQNSVATLGTSLTETHLQKLFRYTSEIIFCFDGDNAGKRAAARSLEISLPEMRDGVSAKFLFLPDGEDPDSMVRNLGHEGFLNKIENSQPLSQFLFEQLSHGIDCSTADGKAKLSKICAPQINRIPKGVFRQLMLEELSRRTGIAASDLSDYVATHISLQQRSQLSENNNKFSNQKSGELDGRDALTYAAPDYYQEFDGSLETGDLSDISLTKTSKIRLTPIKFITALLLNHPALAGTVDNVDLLRQSQDQDTQLFLRVLDLAEKNPHYKPSHIFAYWLGTYGNHEETQILQSLAASEIYHPPVGTGRDDNQEFNDALKHVLQTAFNTLPIDQKAMQLLKRKTLSEYEIKQLHKIRIQLPNNEEANLLKNKIKQRLVV
jgi:DNA primase